MTMADYEAIWAALPQPSLLVDREASILDVNQAAEAFFSNGIAQLRDKRLSSLIGDTSRLLDLVERARGGAVSLSDHGVEVSTADGRVQLVDAQVAAVDATGERVVVMLQPRSIAEQMDRTLTHRAAARTVSGMAAMLAHEIKNPLAGISGAAQLLEMTLGDAERELTELIREETRRIENMIGRVDAFGDTRTTPKEPVNIHDVLDRAKRSAEAGFGAHVRFFTDFDPSLPPVPGDADTLMQAFQNLLKNAAEAAPSVGGVIQLKTAYRPGVSIAGLGGRRESVPLAVTIQDNGSGVPPDIRHDIFEPFVTSKSTGSGLGLAMVSKIVADHGGVIECESEPGRTVMTLRLPVWRDARQSQQEKSS
jgi:two-component system nitrogen regulation sensor histidine kinase GlnL